MTRVDPLGAVTHRDLVDRVRARLVESGQDVSSATVAAALRHDGTVLGNGDVLRVVDVLQCELVGFGALHGLVSDPQVTDVLVNGPQEVYIDRGRGLQRAHVRLADEAAVRRLAQRLATAAGRRLDDASPWVDARLAGGVRLHAVLPPIAADSTLISLRVPRARAFTLPELVASGSLAPAMAALLAEIVTARLAFLVTGGTGTGKTTLLGSLLGLVRPEERLLVVEDTGELRPDHPHVVRLEARPANVEGAGEVSVRSLVRQALRMRPDRLVVGEVRGPEVLDLLAALNTGHDGGCGTIHANSAFDVPARIEALAAMAGASRAAVFSQMASALDVVIDLRRDRSGRRHVAQVCVLESGPSGTVTASPAWTEDGESTGYPRLRALLDRSGDGSARLHAV
jgi:pilus assembly protein CpaF